MLSRPGLSQGRPPWAASLIRTEPGLSVIINAVDEARRICERMMSGTIYRIVETIRILFFIVLAVIGPDAQRRCASGLNDIPIMILVYDNTRPDPKPVRWELHRTIFIS